MKVSNRYFLNKKKKKKLKQELGEYSTILPTKAKVEYLEANPIPFILVDNQPQIILVDGKPFPTLKYFVNNEDTTFKRVVVDMGAVKFMANGADVMSPGIVDTSDEIEKGEIVLIVDETHGKPLAIGLSLISSDEMINNDQGKAVKTIHYIGDDIWNVNV